MSDEIVQWIADLSYSRTPLATYRKRAQEAEAQLTEKGSAVVPFLLAALRGEYDEVIEDVYTIVPHVNDILAKVVDDSVRVLLLQTSHEYSSIETNEAMVAVLQKIGTPKTINTLIEIIMQTNNFMTACTAASALMSIGSEKAVAGVMKMLDDITLYPAHEAAVLMLAEAGDQKAFAPLIKILSDKNTRLSQIPAGEILLGNRFIPALVILGNNRALDTLERISEDKTRHQHLRSMAEKQKRYLVEAQ